MYNTKSTDSKSKNRQMGLYQTEKLLWQAGHSRGRDKEVQTTMYKISYKDICPTHGTIFYNNSNGV